MTDGWDLYAVVRSCTTAAAATTTATASLAENNHDDPSFINIPSFSFSDKNSEQGQSHGLEEILHNTPIIQTKPFFTPHHPNFVNSLENQLQQLPQELNNYVAHSQTSNATRNRRRKNQQRRLVHHMTKEELSNDVWAWRKYGQKPIKGSPYPRNYYRCSTSKGCGAKKLVEINPTDSTIFIVSYTGEHTHPPPTHRNSLAGSTRNKFSFSSSSSSAPPTNNNPLMSTNSTTPQAPTSGGVSKPPSCSPPSALRISPHENTMNFVKFHNLNADVLEMSDEGNDDYDDDNILFPSNVVSTEHMSQEFHEFDAYGGSGFC